jgi:predicted permease
LLRALLRLLPAEFRYDFGQAIEADVSERRSSGDRAGLWWRDIPTLAAAVVREQADTCRQDAKYALRKMRRAPGFTAVVVLILGLGIGATTAIFSVVNAVLIRPLPYPASDQLVRIAHVIGGIDQQYFSEAIFLTYAKNTQAFQGLGVWNPEATATITGQGDPEEVPALAAGLGLLPALGVEPQIGRWFSNDEQAPGGPDTVLLTAGYWQRKLGGDPRVLGRTLTVNGEPREIVGVMPANFRFSHKFEIVLPLRINTAAPGGLFTFVGLARLKPGVTLAQANADAGRILDIWFQRPGANPSGRARWRPALVPLKQDVVGDVGRALWVLLGAIGIVLLMACANVANLLLVRADARRHESAIRVALGASRTRIARQLLVEGLTVALVGGALGVGLAYAGVRLLVAFGPSNLPRLAEISIDPVVLGFAVAISVGSAILFGAIPIRKHTRPLVAGAFGAGRGASMTRERQRSQQTLVAAQLALALVLLVSAGLMIRSFQALLGVDVGFTQPEHVQTVSISIPRNVVTEPERVTRMQKEILEKVSAIPGVVSAGFTTRLPMGEPRYSSALMAEGQVDDGRTPPNRHARAVSPGLFRTQGTPLRGRDFTWTDVDEGRLVAIVSENLARELWGSPADALGKRIREYYDKESPWREVVGVAGDVHDDGVLRPAPATIYWPPHPGARLFGFPGFLARRVSIAVRTERAGTESLLEDLTQAVASVSPTLPLAQVSTLGELYRQSMARTSFTLVLLAIAAAMALLLGLSGIYGVISYAVAQRRREIGIRLALGAEPRDVRMMFVRRGLVLGSIGLAAGLVGAVGFSRLMESLVFGIPPLDPVTFAVTPAILVATAALATYLPARRASAVDPVETMRIE